MEAMQSQSKNVSNRGIKVETDCGYEIQNDNYQMLVVNSNRGSQQASIEESKGSPKRAIANWRKINTRLRLMLQGLRVVHRAGLAKRAAKLEKQALETPPVVVPKDLLSRLVKAKAVADVELAGLEST